MAVKIKLKRMGKIRSPHYRIIVADARTKRDGRAIEQIGKYHPKEHPSLIEVDSERAQYWLGVGAQPTEPVMALLKVTGDWQKFKGLPGAEGTLKTAEPKTDKSEKYNALLAEVHKDDDKTEARKRPAKKAPAKKAAKADESAKAEEKPPKKTAAKKAPVQKAAEATKPADKAVDKPADKAAEATKPADKVADKAAGATKPADKAEGGAKAKDAKADDRPAKKTTAKKAPAKKSAAKEAAGKAEGKADEKADAADAPAEES